MPKRRLCSHCKRRFAFPDDPWCLWCIKKNFFKNKSLQAVKKELIKEIRMWKRDIEGIDWDDL